MTTSALCGDLNFPRQVIKWSRNDPLDDNLEQTPTIVGPISNNDIETNATCFEMY